MPITKVLLILDLLSSILDFRYVLRRARTTLCTSYNQCITTQLFQQRKLAFEMLLTIELQYTFMCNHH